MCDCIRKVNEIITKESGMRLRSTINLSSGISHVALATEPVAGVKRRPYNLIPTYCPFCGEKYPAPNKARFEGN
jgi:hypothetical protein